MPTLRFRGLAALCLVITLVVAASPSSPSPGGRVAAAPFAPPPDRTTGAIGRFSFIDLAGAPGARCTNDLRRFPGTVDVQVNAVEVFARAGEQTVGVRYALYQAEPDGELGLVAAAEPAVQVATTSSPAGFAAHTFAAMPLAPIYLAAVEIRWYDGTGQAVGTALRGVDFYKPYQITAGATSEQTVADACRSPRPPQGALGVDRATVNAAVPFEVVRFPIDSPVDVQWNGRSIGGVTTGGDGRALGRLRVPAAPSGKHTVRWVVGPWSATASLTVVPRIKVTPAAVSRGQAVDVSLRGYAKRQVVRIRWQRGASWVEVARVTTSNTGSANVPVTVPSWAAEGRNAVRGDALSTGGGRAQTNAVFVAGALAAGTNAGSIPIPTATATLTRPTSTPVPPHPTATAAAQPSPSAESTPTAPPPDEPVAAPEPTGSPAVAVDAPPPASTATGTAQSAGI